jgi:hypothetical protein
MLDRTKVKHRVGESIREIGILALVFGPLDAYFAPQPSEGRLVALAVAFALILIAAGIILEADNGR